MFLSFISLSPQGSLSLAVVLAVFVFLLTTRLSADFIFLGGMVFLWLTGVLDTGEALEGFSSPAVVTIGALYAMVAGLRETGGLQWMARQVLGTPRGTRYAQLRLMLPVGMLSGFLNNTPAVTVFQTICGSACR